MTEIVRVNVEWGVQWADGFIDGPFKSRTEAAENCYSEEGGGDLLVSRIAATPWEVCLD
jgi:hypothetical protein